MLELWPDFEANATRSPKTVMAEQAAALKDKTKGKLYARVAQTSTLQDIVLNFHVISPAMGNYKFSLFYVKHTIEGYPLKLAYDRAWHEINKENSYFNVLRIMRHNKM